MNESPAISAIGGVIGILIFAALVVLAVTWIVLPVIITHYLSKIRDAVDTLNIRAGRAEAIRLEEIQKIRAALERVSPVPQELPPEE